MYFSYTGQVSLVAKVNKDGKELLNKHYAGEGSAGLAVAMTAESYAQSLALALSAALKQFVAELDQSLALNRPLSRLACQRWGSPGNRNSQFSLAPAWLNPPPWPALRPAFDLPRYW